MARLVVIEDDLDLQRLMAAHLVGLGHEVSASSRGAEGLEIARVVRPDVVLLDLMLPDLGGMEVVKALRQDPTTRGVGILVVSARGDELDRVVGFELGADDYIVKPFSIRELGLRVAAFLRRQHPAQTTATEFGVLRIDEEGHRVWVGGELVPLTIIEFDLLLALFKSRGRVRTRGQLLDDVWHNQLDAGTRTIDTHMKRLRDKLAAAGAYIETVRGVGFRFAATPEEALHS
jgi:two-component system phosphate regulon response regulator PhoB